MRNRELWVNLLIPALCATLTITLSACGTEPEDVTDDESSALTTDAGSSVSPDGTSSAPPLGPDGSPLPSCVLVDVSPVGQEPTCAAGCWPFYTTEAWGCLPDDVAQGAPAFVGCAPDSERGGTADMYYRAIFPDGIGVEVNGNSQFLVDLLGAVAFYEPGYDEAVQLHDDCVANAD